MFVYEISKLIASLRDAEKDGYEYVELSVEPAEDDDSDTLFLEYIDDPHASETDIIESVVLPENYIRGY